MKNKDIKLGMAVRLKNIPGPAMIVINKTPGLVGSALVSCIWFSMENIQQTGVFRAEFLESTQEAEIEIQKITGRHSVPDIDWEEEMVKMRDEMRADGKTGFVKFGEQDSVKNQLPKLIG